VVIFAGNHPETVAAWWAVLQVGAVVVLANAWWSPAEISRAAQQVEPVLVLADERRASRLPVGTAVLPLESLRTDLYDTSGEDESNGVSMPGADENDPAVILFTSGTTGFPKGAVLSHRSVIANLHNLLMMGRNLPQDQSLDRPPETCLLAVPLFHISGLQSMLMTALTGGRLVFRDEGRFDPTDVLALVEREQVSILGAVPTMLARLQEHPDINRRDLSSVRVITTGGSPVAPVLMERLRRAFPSARRRFGAVYGLSESGGALTLISGSLYEQHPDSSGPPLPVVELRIDRPDAEGVGEVVARSPTNMSGYWGLPEDSTVDEDGWLYTGDLGRLKDGHLVLVGRAKDIIIRGGENVAAAYVEACLLQHPSLLEVAVVGLPHPDLGEEVGAAVVLRPGATETPAQLAIWASERISHFAVPSAWWLRSEPLPVNASGKVTKTDLRAAWPDRSDQESPSSTPTS
jgi:long-chain acyl-CoA synthetase